MSDIANWLGQIGLEQYASLFAENDIDTDVVSELTDDDLKELGVSLGHRKKILRAISSTPEIGQPEAQSSAAAAPAPSVAEAERRQLTVMFVDLVGSTALSSRLDPEDMSAVITTYQNAVAGVITRFSGHVAKYMGDGVLCYFGWPHAHEDDAERAIRAAMAIMQAMDSQVSPDGEALSARVGVATGLVVVGDLIGEGAAQEQAVVGDTPNLAARLQGLAEPGQVVIAASTRQLLADVFELADLGAHELKGIAGSVNAYAVAGERAAESRFAARATGEISPMVGREHELALLNERWQQAKAGEGQLILLSGEAGIGKSRITRAMIDAVASDDHIRLNYQCSPYHTDTALYPPIKQIEFAAGIAAGDSNDTRLNKLEALGMHGDPALYAALLGLDGTGRYEPLDVTPQRQRALTLSALATQIVVLSRIKPVLVVFEDAHWVDATTLELLDLCLDQISSARVLILITARPSFEHGFGGHPIVTRLALNRLGREQVTGIIGKITGGKPLPAELVEEISSKTDGVPLFVEELTKTVLESGELKETDTTYELIGSLNQLAIPATLHDSLMARLDRLQPIKEVAQTAACIGREFDFALLSGVSTLNDDALTDALNQLVNAELIFRRGLPPEATYVFKHALVRDAAYESLLKSRRQTIHAKLVTLLENEREPVPELLAYHCTRAGELDKAIAYWRQAGNAALARTAYTETISHFTAAIELFDQLPPSQKRTEQQLELQIQLAQGHLAKTGYGSGYAAKAYASARVLLDQTERHELLVPVSYGIWIGHYLRAEHEQAYAMVQALVEEVDSRDDPVPRLVAHRMCAATQISLGLHTEAEANLQISLSLYQPDLLTRFSEHFAQEPGIQIRCYLMLCQWMLGYVDQAAEHIAVCHRDADALRHTNTICYGALHRGTVGFMARQDDLIREANGIMYRLGELHGLQTWQSYGLFADILIRSADGDVNALDELPDAFAHYTEEGNWLFIPLYKTEQVRELIRYGRYGEALVEAAETRAIIDRTSERWMLPELLRLTGEAHLAAGDRQAAERHFNEAIAEARRHSAKSWELRAATSLAHLWHDDGDGARAAELLQPVYDWFTEGFDTRDLKEAKALLDAMH